MKYSWIERKIRLNGTYGTSSMKRLLIIEATQGTFTISHTLHFVRGFYFPAICEEIDALLMTRHEFVLRLRIMIETL